MIVEPLLPPPPVRSADRPIVVLPPLVGEGEDEATLGARSQESAPGVSHHLGLEFGTRFDGIHAELGDEHRTPPRSRDDLLAQEPFVALQRDFHRKVRIDVVTQQIHVLVEIVRARERPVPVAHGLHRASRSDAVTRMGQHGAHARRRHPVDHPAGYLVSDHPGEHDVTSGQHRRPLLQCGGQFVEGCFTTGGELPPDHVKGIDDAQPAPLRQIEQAIGGSYTSMALAWRCLIRSRSAAISASLG